MMFRLKTCVYAALLLTGIYGGGDAFGQCILANPSFEIVGSGGEVFAGWGEFGVVGSSLDATHGRRAATVVGPNTGVWDFSGYYQVLDSAPGDRWAASVLAWHSPANPLTGESSGYVSIEWRDGGGAFISSEVHTTVDAFAPPGQITLLSVESDPAPTGTAYVVFVLGVAQGAADPVPWVHYDQATFENLGPPPPEDREWGDFPGGRTIDFSGRTWRVKGPGYYGPGPNLFCDTASCTWVDAEDRLHMTIQNILGSWYSTEVTLEESLGYGDYIFTTLGRLDTLDPNVVLGMFLWQYGPCYALENLWWNPHNEIDVEISRWGDPGNDVAQFVAQPFDWPGNISRFNIAYSEGELISYAFRWHPDRVDYRSWRGGPQDESPGNLIHSWTYTGPHIPRPERPRVHINLWQFENPPGSNQEVIFDEFTFIPSGGVVDVPVDPVLAPSVPQISFAQPNPFRSGTTIRYTIPHEGKVEIAVFDVSGRLIRNLVNSTMPAGDHQAHWDGRDHSGNRIAAGVYLYRLRYGDVEETRRVVFLK
jgi:hypothetical protein